MSCPVACHPPPPPLAVTPATIDLGPVVEGTDTPGRCWLTNPSDAPVTLEPVTTSCGCTTAHAPQTIAPHTREAVTISFHSAYRTGPVHQAVYVKVKGSDAALTIPVVGQCRREIVVSSPQVDMGAAGSGTVTVERVDGKPLTIGNVETPAALGASVVTLSPTKAQIRFSVAEVDLAGAHEGKATIHLNHPALPTVSLPVAWRTRGVYTVAPATANFGLVPHGATRTRTIHLSGANINDLQVTAATGGVRATLAPPNKGERLLTVAWAASKGNAPLLQGTVRLSTGNRAEPTLEIPVYAAVVSGASGDCSASRPCSQSH